MKTQLTVQRRANAVRAEPTLPLVTYVRDELATHLDRGEENTHATNSGWLKGGWAEEKYNGNRRNAENQREPIKRLVQCAVQRKL